ncbi:MAG: efflux RND transporter permease subunit [Chloroflexota bacterium]|nr:MAG: efflux RND transporter permease subunit [Chloroflexota bacterium]
MFLTSISVKRPVAVVAIYLAVAIAGLLALLTLPVNLFPNIDIPVVTILVTYPGAGPDEVEIQVTRPLEDAIAGLNDVDVLTSVSGEGFSQVVVQFTERANPDLIGTDVERRVNSIAQRLPPDVDRPTVTKIDFSQAPVIVLAVSGVSLPPEELYRISDELVRPEIERLNGVGQVSIVGGRQREIRVEVDPDRLRSHGVSLAQVQGALAQANLNFPSGSISQAGRSYSLRLYGLIGAPEDLGRIVVGGPRDAPTRISDIAAVVVGARDQTQVSRVNREAAVVVRVTKQGGANLTDAVDAVKAALPRVRGSLPTGAEIVVVQDNSVSIRQSLQGVREELTTAIFLTAAILLLFLHRLRVSFIVLLSIPTTLLATLVAMQFLNFSLNLLSALGLTLTIGILVDDSIVVLENILRRLGAGDEPTEAAINGRAEIGLAAVAITLVDVVVFAPVGLVSGQIGGFFREFGFTIAAATLFSLIVSFTLTPMLAARLLRRDSGEGANALWGFAGWWDRGFANFEARYRRALDWSMRHRLIVVGAAIASVLFGIGLVATGRVPNEFFPRDDQGIFVISTEAPSGTSLAAHDSLMSQVEARLLEIPEVKTVTASVGAGGSATGFGIASGGQARFGSVTVELIDKSTGRRDIHAVGEEARTSLEQISGLRTRLDVQGAGGGGQPVAVRVQGNEPERLLALSRQVQARITAIPGLRDVTNSAGLGAPELRVRVDRERASDLGVSSAALGQALRTAYTGTVATRYRQPDGRLIDVRLIQTNESRARPELVADLPVPTLSGGTIRLGQIATIEDVSGPSQFNRRGRERVITIGAGIDPSLTLGEVTPLVRSALAEIAVPPGLTVVVGGSAEAANQSFGQLFAALGASILLAYLLMVVLYSSFSQPLVILFALPVAIGGAVGALWVFGYSFNIFAMIGLILLVGLAIKNGILLIDRANQNRRRGLSARMALLEAGPTRLRPILMTSLTITVALLPSALQIGEGAELRAPLAAAVMGGVISSTALTLVLVPVVYLSFDDAQRRIGRWLRRGARLVPSPKGRGLG